MNTPALMIDIETLSTKPDAAIVGIGACLFDMYGSDTEASLRKAGNLFDITISAASNQKVNRHIDADTVIWWMQQSDNARSKLWTGELHNLRSALTALRLWIAALKPAPKFIWANDPDFDVVILQNAFKQCNEMWPFSFWQNRSVRTAKHLAYPDNDAPKIVVGDAHVASDDAIKQALLVQHCTAVVEGRVAVQH